MKFAWRESNDNDKKHLGSRQRERKKKEKKKKTKRRRRRRKRKISNLAASHPSVKGQRPQERWIGAHWESQEANPLPSYRPFGFGPHYRLPAFWL